MSAEPDIDVDVVHVAEERVSLAKVSTVRLTAAQIAERQRADLEAQAAKQRTPPSGLAAARRADALEVSAGAAAPLAPTVARVQARLLDAALGFLGAEGKQVASLCRLASRVAQRLAVSGADAERVPCALQALYVASQLERRGEFQLPEAIAVQKLLGTAWDELRPLLSPCTRGAMAREPVERPDVAAVAVVAYLFNQARTAAPSPQQAKAALGTMRSQKWLPPAALDALQAELQG